MSINEIVSTVNNKTVDVKLENGATITVKQYLPAEEKNNLLEIVLQSAITDTIIDTFALDAFLNLYIVLKYTDIELTEEELANPLKVYDMLESNGLLNEILAAIPNSEYETLYSCLSEMAESYQNYRNSISSNINQISIILNKIVEVLKNVDINEIKGFVSALVEEKQLDKIN